MMAAATKRIPTYAMKLSLLYAAFEHTVPEITEEQIAAAISVAQYGVLCTERLIQNQRQFSTQDRCEQAVIRVLSKANLPPWRIHQAIGGRFTAEDVVKALRGLRAAGAVVPVDKTKRGEPVYGLRAGKP